MIKIAENVFKALKGYTTRADQQEVINSTGKINSRNVIEFLRNYNSKAKNFQNKMVLATATIGGACIGGYPGAAIGLGCGAVLNCTNDAPGEGFFSQLNSEYGFAEKQGIISNVAQKLEAYLAVNGRRGFADEISEILSDGVITSEEAARLDKIAAKSIDCGV